jgi:hypothetical protein
MDKMMQNDTRYDELVSFAAGVHSEQQYSLVGELLSERQISIKQFKEACESKMDFLSNYKIELPSFRKIILRKIHEHYAWTIDKIARDIGIVDPDICMSFIATSDCIGRHVNGNIHIPSRRYDWCSTECEISIMPVGNNHIYFHTDNPGMVAHLSDDDVKIVDIGFLCE